MPGLTLGDAIPNLEVDSTHGKIRLNDFIKDSWAIIFAHPSDFTTMGMYVDGLAKRGVKLLGISCDYISSPQGAQGPVMKFPVVTDPDGRLIMELNMVDPEQRHWSGSPAPSRALHVIGPDGCIKLNILHPASVGRNMDEVLRVVDSLQRTAMFKVATPVNWRPGEPVVISPSVSNEEAKLIFPHGFRTVNLPSKKDYLRFTKVD